MDKRVTVHDILGRVAFVVNSEMDSIRSRLKANNIQLINGRATFEDPHSIVVTRNPQDSDQDVVDDVESRAAVKPLRLGASKFLVACGTKPAHSPMIPCDGVRVLDADHILSGTLVDVPRSLLVVGAGVVGIEYASMINVLPGTTVTVIDARPEVGSAVSHRIVCTATAAVDIDICGSSNCYDFAI